MKLSKLVDKLLIAGLLVSAATAAIVLVAQGPGPEAYGGRLAFVATWEPVPELRFEGVKAGGVGREEHVTQNTLAVACPAWSPDGTRVAYLAPASVELQLYVANADGSDAVVLTDEPFLAYLAPAWSPEGAFIAFVSYHDLNIYVLRHDGGLLRQLTTDGGVNSVPVWSPDGRDIAYSATVDGEPGIFVAPLDGTLPRRLTEGAGPEAVTSWSTDSEVLAFTSSRSGDVEVYTIRRGGGGGLRRVTQRLGQDLHPLWSPDGVHFAYQQMQDDRMSIVVMEVTGLNKRVVIEGPDNQGPYVWSPDGSQIALVSSKSIDAATQTTDVYIVNVTTGERTLVTTGTEQGDCPAWLAR